MMRRLRFFAVYAAALSFAVAAPVLAQSLGAAPLPQTTDQFRRADTRVKLATLRAMASRTVMPTAGNLVSIVQLALDDTAPEVRRNGCRVVTARMWHPRSSSSSAGVDAWRAEKAGLEPVKGLLLGLIRSDPDEVVRREAIIAAGNLDLELEPSDASRLPRVRISAELTAVLADAYRNEQDTAVRTEIVKSLSAARSESSRRSEVLVAALADVAPQVVQYAVLGVGDAQVKDALPTVVSYLQRHPEVRVRLAAAQSLAMYGAAAAPYLPALQEALAQESDPTTRKTIEGTIRVIQRVKRWL